MVTSIDQKVLEDLLYDPVMACEVILGVKLDVFQKARLRVMWFTPDVEDSSGFSSGKTIVDWVACQLSALLIPGCKIVVIYQAFQPGKENFWQYYSKISTPLFRSQLGRLDVLGEKGQKSEYREPGCFKQWFRNGSCVSMPAPGFHRSADNLAGLRCHRMLIDEWTKIMTSEGGVIGITKQLMGRATESEFNQHHPIWSNKIWKTATAEMSDHPAYPSHAKVIREIKSGNPDFYYLHFCFKDYSGFPSYSGRSFKDEFRNLKRIHSLIVENTKEKVLAEVFGIWSKMSQNWFSGTGFEMCRAIGAKRNVLPLVHRDDDQSYFFAGIDPAASKLSTSDRGGLAIIRARKLPGADGHFESDWQVDLVMAKEIRCGDTEIWSGVIHQMHNEFGLAGIVMDAGGGGIWIAPDLKKPTQTIAGVQVQCTPIVLRSAMEIEGHQILSLVDVNDSGMLTLFPDLKNGRTGDRLKDNLMTIVQVAFEKGMIGLPPDHFEVDLAVRKGWSGDMDTYSQAICRFVAQALKVRILMDEKGGWKTTRNHARIFFSPDYTDIVDAVRNAYAAFRIWLLGADFDSEYGDNPLGDSH